MGSSMAEPRLVHSATAGVSRARVRLRLGRGAHTGSSRVPHPHDHRRGQPRMPGAGRCPSTQAQDVLAEPAERTAMVQLSWLWLRHQPQSALSLWFDERTKGAGGRNKHIVIIALARKLLISLWRFAPPDLFRAERSSGLVATLLRDVAAAGA